MENENRELSEFKGSAPALPRTVDAIRVQKETEGAIIIAQKFPRSHEQAYTQIMKECNRPTLAEKAMYSYPRGNTTVTGPSIRLAEAIARHYRNLSFGIRELSRNEESSSMEAFCWDMENNVRASRNFDVPHIRESKAGNKKLTDSRDIYEITANMGARRLRACILEIIPGDLVEQAIEQCEKTSKGNVGADLEVFRRKLLAAFDKVGVTLAMIEKRLGHKIAEMNQEEAVEYNKILISIAGSDSKREDWFQFAAEAPTTDEETAALNKKLTDKRKERETAKGLTEADKAAIEAEEKKQAERNQ